MEREKQLMEKQRKVHDEIQEEQIYARLWDLDRKKKEERDRIEAEEKKKLQNDTMAVLDWQKQTRDIRKMEDKNAVDNEKAMLRTQWQKEEEYEKDIEKQKFMLNRERNLELIRHNEAEKQLRDEQEKMEKLRDKQMLQAALDREKAIEDLESEEKRQRRQEVIELQKHYF